MLSEKYSAFFYSAYIMEELGYPKDTGRMTIATGCVGTRTGLREQPNRCLFSEFIDYLWSRENVPHPQSKPDPKLVLWGNAADATKLKDATISTMTNWVSGVKNTKVIDPATGEPALNDPTKPYSFKLVKIPEPGYTGLLDSSKLVASPADYYDAIYKVGVSAWNAKDAYLKDTSIDVEERKNNVWPGRCADGAATVANYRVLDEGKFQSKYIAGKLKDEYGIKQDVVRRPVTLFGGDGARVAGAMDLDIAETATKWAPLVGKEESEIRAKITGWLEGLAAGTGTAEHNKALEASKKAVSMVETGVC
jgi:hypothetical protein